jgi:hypothetical protein
VLLAHPQVGRQTPVRIHRWRPSVRIGTARRKSPLHIAIIAAVSTARVITVIGGCSLGWNWIDYLGNSLWDWLQLVLVPLVFPARHGAGPGGIVNAECGADQPVRRARLDDSDRFPDRPSGCQPTAPRRLHP